MEREQFIIAENAQKISRCRDRFFALCSQYHYEDERRAVEENLRQIKNDKMIRMAFIGQYTAGKSSIISALTGDNMIKIDSDITTDVAKDYYWTDGVLLTDTPGLHTETHPEHDQRTIEMIRQSDLLVYCITSDLFNPKTVADFEKWAFEKNYSGKMFLVVNKMSKDNGTYPMLTESYTKTINDSLYPHSIAEFPCAFVDAKDYRDGVRKNDGELVALSHFDGFIAQLNRFVAQKGQLGKLDTPIQILKSAIDEITEKSMNSEQDKAYVCLLSRIEKKVDQSRSQADFEIRSCIHRELRPILDKGYELSKSIGVEDMDFREADYMELITSACDSLNTKLNKITQDRIEALNNDISQVVDSAPATFFFNSVGGNISKPKSLFEHKQLKINRAQFEAVTNLLSQVTGKTFQLATKGGTTGFFIKATQAADSPLHIAVKTVGKALGHKFRPWEAVNIAKNIGNVARCAGPVISVFGFLLDAKDIVDEAGRLKAIEHEQIRYRQYFAEVVSDLEKQYLEQTNGIFEVYGDITRKITQNRAKLQKMIDDHSALTEELAGIKADLTDIQAAIL